MKKFFVIGNKVSKSLSPTIFNYWFKKHNIDAHYGHLELNDKNFESKIKELLTKRDLAGLNITIPYKEKIFSFKEIFLEGLAPDGGLFVPKKIPLFSSRDLKTKKAVRTKEKKIKTMKKALNLTFLPYM